MEKRYFLYYVIVVVYLCIVAPARADTTVGGSITAATTWTKEESPYLVTETVEVIEGVTLTIEPGVKAVCNRDTGLVVWGQLIAAGTQEEMIEFTSAEAAPSPGDWDGICF